MDIKKIDSGTWISIGLVVAIAVIVRQTLKQDSSNEEEENMKRQSCLNAAIKANIPEEKQESFVEDCLAAID